MAISCKYSWLIALMFVWGFFIEDSFQLECPRTDLAMTNGHVADSWVDGFALEVEIVSLVDTDDWEILVILPRPLSAAAEILSWSENVDVVDGNRTHLVLSSVSNYTTYADERLSCVFIITNIDDPLPLLDKVPVKLFSHHVSNESCFEFASQSPTTITTTFSQTTIQETTPTTTQTTTQTTSQKTTTMEPVSKCQRLLRPEGFSVENRGWQHNKNGWRFIGRVQKEADGRGLIKDWIIKLVFDVPVTHIDAYESKALNHYKNGRVWFLTAASWNHETMKLDLRFQASLNDHPDAPEGVAYLCRDGEIATHDITQPSFTAQPFDVERDCDDFNMTKRCSSEQMDGCLPKASSQTKINFTRSAGSPLYDYNEVLHKSILFYEAQRSGKLPADNRIPWRGDSGLKDGCDVGHDLTGGWYDAGDNVKFGFPMAYTATVLAWGMIEFQEAYQEAGEWDNAVDMLRWGTDYFIKAHTKPNELYVQVGDPKLDHSRWWRPEDYMSQRKSYKIDVTNPGTEVAAETAAALAAASIVFKEIDPAYSVNLLTHSIQLYDFGDNYRKEYHNSVKGVEEFYRSWSGFHDELLWSGLWLYRASKDRKYIEQVSSRYDQFDGHGMAKEFSWDNKFAGAQVLMAQATNESKYREDVVKFMASVTEMKTTPKGLTYFIQWGPNRYAANFALIGLMAAKLEPALPDKDQYIAYAKKQIHNVLGSGDGQRSYVVGFGKNPPTHEHHRGSSCPSWTHKPVPICTFGSFSSNAPNPHTLFGALVGGPSIAGSYRDTRDNYVTNEVATDYNAGFQSAVAGLKYFQNH